VVRRQARLSSARGLSATSGGSGNDSQARSEIRDPDADSIELRQWYRCTQAQLGRYATRAIIIPGGRMTIQRFGRRRRSSLASDSHALLLAAPEVVAHRVLRMWLSGGTPPPRDRAEFRRMSTEKVAAFYESWNAMFLEMCRANVRLAQVSIGWPWSRAMSRQAPARLSIQGGRAVGAVLGAGLAPIRRRAVANAKRLRRAGR
jgi:hypothetical protein